MPENSSPATFEGLAAMHRNELMVHLYRMLGSVHDAEDVLQEAMLRAWRGIDRFDGTQPRAWLYRITTNAALDALARRGRPTPTPERAVQPWPDEQYDQREAVELAFVVAVQRLAPTPRAVLLLREVLGFTARETAAQLDTTVAAVNSALQRARAAMGPVPSRGPARVDDPDVQAVVRRYVEAWERHDVPALAALLAEDVRMSMPPTPLSWHGRDEFLAAVTGPGSPFHLPWRYLPTSANGRPALGSYRATADGGRFEADSIVVLTIEGGEVREIVAFGDPTLHPAFGLPSTLAA